MCGLTTGWIGLVEIYPTIAGYGWETCALLHCSKKYPVLESEVRTQVLYRVGRCGYGLGVGPTMATFCRIGSGAG